MLVAPGETGEEGSMGPTLTVRLSLSSDEARELRHVLQSYLLGLRTEIGRADHVSVCPDLKKRKVAVEDVLDRLEHTAP
jgi:hypothetical protein